MGIRNAIAAVRIIPIRAGSYVMRGTLWWSRNEGFRALGRLGNQIVLPTPSRNWRYRNSNASLFGRSCIRRGR